VHQIPGQQFLDPIGGMVGDPGEHVTQVGFRIQAVQLGRPDEAVERGSSFTAGIGAGEEVVLPPQGDRAQGTFGGVVVDLDTIG
jgi:hypothetical protein